MLSIVLCIFGGLYLVLACICYNLAIHMRDNKFYYRLMMFLGIGCTSVGLVYFIANAFIS